MRARVKKITVMRTQLTYISRDNFAITIYVSILLIVNFEPDFDKIRILARGTKSGDQISWLIKCKKILKMAY